MSAVQTLSEARGVTVASPAQSAPVSPSQFQATRPIAYIMSRFPKLTETFILREMIELERQGQPLVILPLLRERAARQHPDVARLTAHVHYTPLLSPAIVWANLSYALCAPQRYFGALWLALRGNWGSVNLFFGAIGIFPKSVYLARLIARRGIGHVHAHYATHPALAALIIAELTGVTFSFTAHAHDIFVDTQMLDEKITRAQFVVTISEFNKQHLLRLCANIPEEKIHVIHCGVDLQRYAPASTSQANHPLTLITVASLEPYKGLTHLLKACHLLRPHVDRIRCLVVGDGPQRPHLERLMTRLDLHETVQLLGGLPQDEVASLLAEADLFLLPSVIAPDGQMEGIPVALMEAMASGLPVIATRLSGVPELVRDGETGLLVPPADPQALAQAIVRCARDPALRQSLGHQARALVTAQFELSQNVERLRSLFSQATAFHQGVFAVLKERFRSNGASPHALRLGPRLGGQDSDVYALRFQPDRGTATTRLIWKLHRPAWAHPGERLEQGRRHAAREYETLTMLWDAFSQRSPRFRVPQPLGHFPEQAAVLMTHCEGERLNDRLAWMRLRALRARPSRLIEDVRACGEWLGLFHQITARDGDAREAYRLLNDELSRDLTLCEPLGLSQELAGRIAREVAACEPLIADDAPALVGVHGDFGPHNICVTQTTVSVIDFEGFRPGLRYRDVANFLAMLEARSCLHLGPAWIRELTEQFLRGYTRYQTVDRTVLRITMLAAMVTLMAHNPVFTPTPKMLVWGVTKSPAMLQERWCRRRQRQRYLSWLRSALR